jgi:hypothetical protein
VARLYVGGTLVFELEGLSCGELIPDDDAALARLMPQQ